RLHVLTNQKGKWFKDSLVAEKSSFGHQLTLADFDQDGDMDVFTVSSPSDNLSYFENLTINCKRSYSNQAISICDGDSVQVGKNYYRTAATVVDSSISSSGCDSIAIYEIDVNTDPKLQVKGTADFIYLANAGQVDSIKWFLDGKEVNAAKNDTLFPTQTGNYYAEYEVNGCLFTSNTLYHTLVGLPNTEMQIAVYPNPTMGIVNVVFEGEELFEYRLLNLQGKEIVVGRMNTNLLDFSAVEGGVYVLEFSSSKRILTLLISILE
ncbi:MAG: T9SS type A sorting domain-containing protein, partial [Bacteroidetes bacterium]|nr:T9SS type A sorting domain-containing protein [Bacteroidota bacterium]